MRDFMKILESILLILKDIGAENGVFLVSVMALGTVSLALIAILQLINRNK